MTNTFDPIGDVIPAIRVSRAEHEASIYARGVADGRAQVGRAVAGEMSRLAAGWSRDLLALGLFLTCIICAFALLSGRTA